ncbi:MAG TPA: hypothetical protein VIM53_00765 [Candidatus Saccharimonadales bacterium]
MSMEHVTSTGKDTIYIDVDDEITTIIDKVRSSHARIVALVLPKRAPVLQSIVNMKLLKRNAETAKKHLVLITSEASLLPLAGSVEMYVAKTLQSKPEIPPAPELPGHHADEDDDEAVRLDDEAPAAAKGAKSAANAAAKEKEKLDVGKSVGELAAGTIATESIDDAIDLDNDADMSAGDLANAADKVAKSKKKSKGDKKLRIPNFDKFRLLLALGVVGFVALIVLFIICVKVLPKATVTIDTNRQAVNISPTLTLNPSANTVDTSGGVVPAQSQTVTKTFTGTANASGQKNEGTAATGSVTMSAGACTANAPADVPAGSGLTASLNNATYTYITQSDMSFVPSLSHGKCTYVGQSSVNITAQNPGAAENTNGSVSFNVSGRSDVSASGSTSGGTDNVVQVVQQSDIDSATSKIAAQDTTSIKQQLSSSLTGQGSTPIAATFTASTPAPSPSVAAGAQATSVTVTEQITYTMLGARQSDLEQIVKTAVAQQVNLSKQNIVDYGLSSASYSQPSANGNAVSVNMQDTAVVGSELNTASLAKQIAGKKTSEATSIIKSNPGVTNVTIKYSPFWVMSVPKNASKVTVHIDQPKTVSNG